MQGEVQVVEGPDVDSVLGAERAPAAVDEDATGQSGRVGDGAHRLSACAPAAGLGQRESCALGLLPNRYHVVAAHTSGSTHERVLRGNHRAGSEVPEV